MKAFKSLRFAFLLCLYLSRAIAISEKPYGDLGTLCLYITKRKATLREFEAVSFA